MRTKGVFVDQGISSSHRDGLEVGQECDGDRTHYHLAQRDALEEEGGGEGGRKEGREGLMSAQHFLVDVYVCG